MARKLNRLSARAVATVKTPGRHADGGNLYLVVDKSGAKRWTFFFRRRGHLHEMGLGGANSVNLARARELAAACRDQLARGLDPIAARKSFKAATPTFGEAAEAFIVNKAPGWRSIVHREQWEQSLRTHAAPIWATPINAIGLDDVLLVLKPLWTARPETARRVRGRIEMILDAGKAAGHRSGENPARWRGNLDHFLAKPPKIERSHFEAMPFPRVPGFVDELRKRPSIAALAVEFVILSAARLGEVLGATWSEIDLDERIWTIPASRMKSGREHRAPVSVRGIEVLEELAKLRTSDFVVPGFVARRPFSPQALRKFIRRLGVGNVTPHGFRSSFRDWCGEKTHFPREIAEAALAHQVGDETERAYRRGDALERRREVMESWARFCSSSPAKVIQLRPGAA
jgi:integrase